MSIRLKKLLALSLSISLAATGIITDVGENSIFAAAASKTTEVKVKKVQITVAQKKTIKAPKSEKKAVWSIVSGQQNISVPFDFFRYFVQSKDCRMNSFKYA